MWAESAEYIFKKASNLGLVDVAHTGVTVAKGYICNQQLSDSVWRVSHWQLSGFYKVVWIHDLEFFF